MSTNRQVPTSPASPRERLWGPVTWYGLGATLVVLALSVTDAWQGFEERAQGLLLRQVRGTPWNSEVVLVTLDEESYSRLGRPMPRALMARVVTALGAAGVRALAFDIAFNTHAYDGPEADRLFAEAVANNGRVVLAVECLAQSSAAQYESDARVQLLPRGKTPAARCAGFSVPHDQLPSLARLAHFQVAGSHSGYARSVVPLAESNGRRLPGLALAAYLLGQGLPWNQLEQGPSWVQLQDLKVPVNEQGSTLTSFRVPPDTSVFSLGRLLDALPDDRDEFPPEVARSFAGKYVLVGVTAEAMGDVGPLATGERGPMVLLHAAMLSDLLERKFVEPLPWGLGALLILLSGALLTLAAQTMHLWRGVLALVTLLLVVWALSARLVGEGVWIEPLAIFLAGAVAYGTASSRRLALRERERRLLRDAFGAYVDRRVLEQLMGNPQEYLSLGGAKRTVTVLFSDLVGFTALSNRLDPEQVISMLREYLEVMTRLITSEGGRVDKIMGDGVLAVFGDPMPAEDHAVRAVRVAVGMNQALHRLGLRWRAESRPQLLMRVGVATGEVHVGNIGSVHTKLEYTVLGQTVNLAARLESKAPPGGVLVAAKTAEACGHLFEFQRLPPLRLKGYPDPQAAYLLMGPAPDAQSPRRHARVSAVAAVEISREELRLVGTAANVSTHGLFVATSLPAEVGDRIALRFPNSSMDTETVYATVRWRGTGPEGQEGLGLALESPELSEHVAAILYSSNEESDDSTTPTG